MRGKYIKTDKGYVVGVINPDNTYSIFEGDVLPDRFQEITEGGERLLAELEDYIRERERKRHSFLYKTRKDLVAELHKKIKNPTPMHYAMAISFYMLKLSAFFNERPDLLFEFPLYLEYIQKHGLDREEYTVEEFLSSVEDILETLV